MTDHPIVAMHLIGWSANDPLNRNVSRAWFEDGWRGFVAQKIEPLIAVGVTRFELHNPWGCLAEPFMQFSQYEAAKSAGLTWLTDDFVAAWKPITARGIEVIGYVGAPIVENDNKLKRCRTNATRLACVNRNLKPMLDAGMSIAFDAASGAQMDSLAHGTIRQLRGLGVKVYIEAVAHYEHLTDLPAIFTDRYWNHPDRPTWAIHPSTVEMIRMCPDSAPTIELLRECRAAGHTLLAGMTVDVAKQLLAETN